MKWNSKLLLLSLFLLTCYTNPLTICNEIPNNNKVEISKSSNAQDNNKIEISKSSEEQERWEGVTREVMPISVGRCKGFTIVMDKITAYSYMDDSGMSVEGKTATELYADRGSIAIDPSVIPVGVVVYVPGYGYGVTMDTGGNIKGKRMDLFFPNREKALDWGVKYNIEVMILETITY